MDPSLGRLDVVAFDCPDPRALAAFYRSLVGGEVHADDEDDDWVELHTANGRLAFQQIANHRPPTWPEGDVPQQAHVDVKVVDLDAAERDALDLGAVKADVQRRPHSFRVFYDPAGHPFCLVAGG